MAGGVALLVRQGSKSRAWRCWWGYWRRSWKASTSTRTAGEDDPMHRWNADGRGASSVCVHGCMRRWGRGGYWVKGSEAVALVHSLSFSPALLSPPFLSFCSGTHVLVFLRLGTAGSKREGAGTSDTCEACLLCDILWVVWRMIRLPACSILKLLKRL